MPQPPRWRRPVRRPRRRVPRRPAVRTIRRPGLSAACAACRSVVGGGLQCFVGDGCALLGQPVSDGSQLGTLGGQFVVRKGCLRRYFGELGRGGGRDLAVRLEVGARFDTGRVGLLELGTGGGGVHRDVVGVRLAHATRPAWSATARPRRHRTMRPGSRSTGRGCSAVRGAADRYAAPLPRQRPAPPPVLRPDPVVLQRIRPECRVPSCPE